MKKCPRTTTGKHEFREFSVVINTNLETIKKCIACGILDNKK